MRVPEREECDVMVIPVSEDGSVNGDFGKRIDWHMAFRISRETKNGPEAVLLSFEKGIRARRILCIRLSSDFTRRLISYLKELTAEGERVILCDPPLQDLASSITRELPGVSVIELNG